MKFFNEKITFILSIFQIIFLVLIPLFTDAAFGIGNVSGKVRNGINNFVENDLNINVHDSLQPLTESINVVDTKGSAPEVSLRFSTPSPKEGEEITVSADVTNLANPGEAYYVWYLKRQECEGDLTEGLNCDDIEDQKVLAIRAEAELYFDPLTFDQEMNGGDNDDNFLEEYGRFASPDDDDGFVAPLGGGDQDPSDDAINYCYMYDVETGVQYELADPGTHKDEGCPDGYEPRCLVGERDIQCPTVLLGVEGEINTDASSTASADSGSGDTSTSADTSSDSFVEGGDGARFRMLAKCVDTKEEPSCVDGEYSCQTADGDNGSNYDYDAVRTLYPTPYCVPKDAETGQLWVDPNTNGCPAPQWYYCFENEMCDDEPAITETCGIDSCADRPGYYGNSCHDYYENGPLLKPGKCDINSTDENTCGKEMHPFPDGAGDGVFGVAEEARYHLDPRTDRTTPLAKNDEALVTGLGMRDFTWRYKKGDEIGVIVEGISSQPTKHQDSTAQTIFALMNPSCKGYLNGTGSYEEVSNDKKITILTGEVDEFNECINGNELYVKPGFSEYDSLDVKLTLGSDFENNAALSSGLGQKINISSTVSQIQSGEVSKSEYVYYEWEMFCGKSEENIETNITDFMHKCKNMTNNEGMGLSVLNFISDFPDGHNSEESLQNSNLTNKQQEICIDEFAGSNLNCFGDNARGFVKLKLKVNEPREGGGSNFGKIEQIFEIFNIKDNPIKAYQTEVKNNKFEKTSSIETQTPCEVSVDGEEGIYIGNTIDNRPTYVFNKDGTKYCGGVGGTCNIQISGCTNDTYTLINPEVGAGSNGIYEDEEKDFIWNSTGEVYDKLEILISAALQWNKTPQSKNNLICNEGEDKVVCRVMDNEVIALEATLDGEKIADEGMVAWTVNEKQYECDSSLSSLCDTVDGKGQNTIVVPIMGSSGQKITVDATVSEVDVDTNNSYSLSREFEIVDPSVTIKATTLDGEPLEGAVTGYYKNIDVDEGEEGEFVEKRSDTVFVANEGDDVVLTTSLFPNFLNRIQNGQCNNFFEDIIKYKWYVNGKEVSPNTNNDGESLAVTIYEDTDILVKGELGMCLEDRKARYDTYGATLFDTSSKAFEGKIKITTQPSSELTGVKGFFATTAHNAPEYFIFLLKMTLMIGVILFASSFALGFGVRE